MQKLSIGTRAGLSKDTRKDLGYGRADTNFHTPRQSFNTFPYMSDGNEPEGVELSEDEEDLVRDIVRITLSDYSGFDIGAKNSSDKKTYVSNQRLSTMGEGPSGRSMVPFPKMYSKRIQAGGGATSPKAVSTKSQFRTGTKRGWSNAPIPIVKGVEFNEIEEDYPQELIKVRNAIKRIIAQEKE